jgi:hypothetical protein
MVPLLTMRYNHVVPCWFKQINEKSMLGINSTASIHKYGGKHKPRKLIRPTITWMFHDIINGLLCKGFLTVDHCPEVILIIILTPLVPSSTHISSAHTVLRSAFVPK